MSELISWNQGTPPAQLPVAIDYSAALALRQMAVVQDELPKYLLAPEVSALLHYVPDLRWFLPSTTLSVRFMLVESISTARLLNRCTAIWMRPV